MKTSKLFTQSLLTILLLYPAVLFGQTQKQQRETTPFTGVSTTGINTVYLTQEDNFSIVVEALPEYLDGIETTVRNNTLNIRYTGSLRSSGDIKIYVTAPLFEQLTASGASSFIATGLLSGPSLSTETAGASNMKLEVSTDYLSTKVSGASNVTLSGETIKHDINASGACLVRAYELASDVTEAVTSGASNVRLTVNEVLKVQASGTANVTYKGTPAVKNISSSGLANIRALDANETYGTDVPGDTVTVRVGQREIKVTDEDDKIRRWRIEEAKRRKFIFINNWSGLELGVNGFLTADNSLTLPADAEQFDLRYNKSVAVNINLWQQNLILAREHLAIVTGLGIGWNNYRFLTDDLLVKGAQQVEHDPGLYNYKKNKLTMMFLNVPLMLEYQTSSYKKSGQFHIAAGVNIGFRLRSHTKQMVFIDGDRERFKEHSDFHMNPFRYDATARIGWGHINLFASYSLNPLFKDGKGPELFPFSAGIRVVSF